MSLSQIQISSQVGTAVLKNTMDMNEALGAGLINMLDAASIERMVNPAVGSNLDLRI